jgi:hypothetical protein
MKRGFILVLSVIFLGGLIWTAQQIEKKSKLAMPAVPQISSESQRNLPDDIEIVANGTNFPTMSVGYQVKFGEHILARGSTWTQTRVSGILPHNIIGAQMYPVSIINSLTKQSVSNTVQYFLLYNLTGYTPKLWVGPGTRIHISTPLGFDKAEVSIYAKFDGQSIWPGYTFSYSKWTVDFDIPKDVAVPSTHQVYLWENGKTISNTITINVTGKPPIIKR